MRKKILSYLILGFFLTSSFSSLTVLAETTTTSTGESTTVQSSSLPTSTVSNTTGSSSSEEPPSTSSSVIPPSTTTTESSTSVASTTTESDSPKVINESATGSVAIYRLYNAKNGEHLYTTDANEKKVLYERHGWGYEGIGWYAPKSGTPVYRLYNAKLQNHLYTTDKNEVRVLTSRYGWTSDNRGKPVFYSGGKIKIYRVYNHKLRGLHHWTTDSNEYNVLPRHGWKQEGVKFTGVRNGKPIRTQYYGRRDVDIYAIAKGDLSSLEGTWRNGYGEVAVFNKHGLGKIGKITIISVKHASLQNYNFQWHWVDYYNTFVSTYFVYGPPYANGWGTSAYIVPKGNICEWFDNSDKNKDRIIFGGQGVPRANDSNLAFYRIK